MILTIRKILLAIIFVLLLSGNVFATALTNCSGPSTYTGSSGCLLRETFEGCAANCTSCTSGYSWTIYAGTPNCANTSTPLEGSQSFGGAATAVTEIYTNNVGMNYPTLYATFMLNISSCSTAYPVPFGFSNSAGSDVAYLSYTGSCAYRACNGSTCTSTTTGTDAVYVDYTY